MTSSIFIAEDNEDDWKLFQEALSNIFSSYKIHRVHDGLECIYSLKNFTEPNYIFLDLNMPLKNGIDCLKVIRDMPGFATVPVIIFSATHHMKDIDMAFKSGATYYLVKPSSVAVLTSLLQHLFTLLNQPDFVAANKHQFVLRHKIEVSDSGH